MSVKKTLVRADKDNIPVTISLSQFESLESSENALNDIIGMLERANKNGEAVMTDELRLFIEEIYY